MQRITERTNFITRDIDVVGDVDGMVRLLRTSDAQMFCGYEDFPSCFDEDCLGALEKISLRMKLCMQDRLNGVRGSVVMSGCGTSGRIAYFCSKNYNYCFRKVFSDRIDNDECFQFIIAGGVNALVSPQEAAEDKPDIGARDLVNVISNTKTERGLFIGITCGFSAGYVAGQVMQLSEDKSLGFDSVLFGFNPKELARDSPIEGWRDGNISFKDVIENVEKNQSREDEFFFLNPIVGPESITGSTRMKGGSATKFLLDVAFSSAIMSILDEKKKIRDNIIQVLSGFEHTVRSTYDFSSNTFSTNSLKSITPTIEMAANSLKNGNLDERNEDQMGHIYYIGAENAGILGFIDSSECVPTYGAHPNDVRGFIKKGWNDVFTHHNQDINSDFEQKGSSFGISYDFFKQNILHTVNSRDSVFFLAIEQCIDEETLADMKEILNTVKERGASVCWILVTTKGNNSLYQTVSELGSPILHHALDSLGPVPFLYGYAELSMKLFLNAITTGAHVLKGMTFGNRMINLKVSNNKLFYRAINIVSSIMNVTEELAEKCVLRAIYNDSTPESNLVSLHISHAIKMNKVVPVALLLASSGGTLTVEQAREMLAKDPVVRQVILKEKKN
ncbi:hypothetical protein NAEGRDRAFT_78308 [Naegleria gruberi]|uniref:Uncharacterized protein AM34 n=1 Tax=Naegleria gruberi TaxID=5762 RepID=D2V2M4_NAEGR|nr:uncharacterized protein NAEGRDRAFT_78308 [Naegleria gruberi]EFC48924.1 hypothetical protein NAEGRDRAFT_78308 [Naegleria gruberi]|eukprot:XP_002681668.1 hypothetical protein NAEGRDRAFT_78308 [Naegleria gruberi strain NEG-M]